MNKLRLSRHLCAALLLLALGARGAHAQAAARVYVTANKGADLNPCTRTSPCRTIQHALDATVVQQGGAVVILDSGDYAPFTISATATPATVTAVTVEAAQGTAAGITANAPGALITIQAGAS